MMASSTTLADHKAEREKRLVALGSVIAAVGLATFKLAVGLMTGSLGILSEAAHSGLDLVAALVTFFAVRISDKPPDQRHRYGHGKVENLSALIETLLLLLTCAWIIYEAIRRLFFEEVAVEASIWAFVVMGVSILVDFSRSRVLARTARRHNSQALEADALHFSTDIWSSSVVILGLIGVRISETSSRLDFLAKADAVAALVVAVIVIYVSIQLGRRSVAALLDSAPPGLAAKIERAVRAVPGVLDRHRVRVRTAGPQLFVDIHVVMDGALSLEATHTLSNQIEEIIAGVAPGADVTVHAEPPSEAQPQSE
jgi:cation diffusion facilitator family transporter